MKITFVLKIYLEYKRVVDYRFVDNKKMITKRWIQRTRFFEIGDHESLRENCRTLYVDTLELCLKMTVASLFIDEEIELESDLRLACLKKFWNPPQSVETAGTWLNEVFCQEETTSSSRKEIFFSQIDFYYLNYLVTIWTLFLTLFITIWIVLCVCFFYGRIVFWAQLGPKINIWSSNHPYLSLRIWDSNR